MMFFFIVKLTADVIPTFFTRISVLSFIIQISLWWKLTDTLCFRKTINDQTYSSTNQREINREMGLRTYALQGMWYVQTFLNYFLATEFTWKLWEVYTIKDGAV